MPLVRILLIVFIFLFSGMSADAKQNDPNYCGPENAPFPKCAKRPVFKTVVLTIHGWNGSCKTTFGEDKSKIAGSLYSLLKDRRFFDFDCFGYDSESFSIDQVVIDLEKHIDELRKKGYREILLVTHSTGGIVALDYLTRRLEKAVKTGKYDTIKIPTLIAWATPIKGIRRHINAAEFLLNFIGLEQNALPQLDDAGDENCTENNSRDDCFLSRLRGRLKNYRKLMLKIPQGPRNNYDTHVEFYHGNSKDWVVKPIPENSINEGWIWPDPYGEVVDINQGHLANIGKPGTNEVHRYPLKIVKSKALIDLPLNLNLDGIFPMQKPVYITELLPYQTAMANGVSYHAKTARNADNLVELLAFWRRIFLDEYPRKKAVDYLVLNDLGQVFGVQLIRSSSYYRKLSLSFVEDILAKYNSLTPKSDRSPGGGEKEFISKVIFHASSIYKAISGSDADDQSYIDTQAKIVAFMSNSLNSPQQAVIESAIKNLYRISDKIPDTVVNQVDLISRLDNYYSPKSDKLGSTAKEQIGLTVIEFSKRGGKVGLDASRFLNKKVNFGDAEVPVWKSFQSPKVDNKFIQDLDSRNIYLKKDKHLLTSNDNLWFRELASTHAGLSAFAGSRGNQKELIEKGYYQGLSYYRLLPAEDQSELDKKLLRDLPAPEPEQGYYFMQRRYNPIQWSRMNSNLN